MIGEIRWSLAPYYNREQHCMRFKKRPMLVIGNADAEDVVAIPISRVTNKVNLNPVYDVRLDPKDLPELALTEVCYARTHKQLTVHSGEIAESIGDLKGKYPALFKEILDKRDQFSRETTLKAIAGVNLWGLDDFFDSGQQTANRSRKEEMER